VGILLERQILAIFLLSYNIWR